MYERRTYLGPLTDSRRWDHIDLRKGDIIVATPPKCGTTWMQTIIALLLSGDPDVETELPVKMPWVDIRFREIGEVAARLREMTHRRSMKSHTPLDGLPIRDDTQYVCVFRHPLDAHFSYRRHLANTPVTFFDHWYPEEDSDGMTFRRFLDGGAEGFDGDAMPLAHILRHYEAARALADRPNVTLFHDADMTRDLPGTMASVAARLEIDVAPELLERLVEAATFENMRAAPSRYAPGGGTCFFKSDAAFFHSASSGKWVGKLSEAEIAAYDAAMDAALEPAARAWLEFGTQGTARADI